MKTLRILMAGALAVALAGCGSDSTGPGPTGKGKSQVRADLSGALSGRVDISGSFVDPSKGMVFGAMGTTDGETTLVIHATDPHFDDATRPGRGVALVFLTPRTGTYNTADLCTAGTGDHRCVLITLTDKSTDGYYVLSSGRVTVSKFTNNRITGTFEGQGLGVSGEDVIHFKDGRFDVEFLDVGDVSETRAGEHPAIHLFDELR
jgi:hypothetical protein